MTLDEARARVQALAQCMRLDAPQKFAEPEKNAEALDIGLWLMEREQHIARLMELVRATDLMRVVAQLEVLRVLEEASPPPFSR